MRKRKVEISLLDWTLEIPPPLVKPSCELQKPLKIYQDLVPYVNCVLSRKGINGSFCGQSILMHLLCEHCWKAMISPLNGGRGKSLPLLWEPVFYCFYLRQKSVVEKVCQVCSGRSYAGGSANDARRVIFQGEQSINQRFKDLIESTCRRFNLRHVFSHEGTQSFYITMTLQYGFAVSHH